MFRREGLERSHRHNRIIAGYLSFVAGYVNSAGFVIIGVFTSHVTGSIGRFADDLALGRATAVFAALLVVAYFAGAFLASVALESNLIARRSSIYGALLLAEAGLLAAFAVVAHGLDSAAASPRELQAALLCGAMGLQNSLVTRLSGAVVRTTHLTGIVTDLGIESARWFRSWRGKIATKTRLRLVAGDAPPGEPNLERTKLLLTIAVAFIAGSASGATAAAFIGAAAIFAPTAALVGLAAYALRPTGHIPGDRPADRPGDRRA